jgi:hypothetical protein
MPPIPDRLEQQQFCQALFHFPGLFWSNVEYQFLQIIIKMIKIEHLYLGPGTWPLGHMGSWAQWVRKLNILFNF